MIGLGNSRAEKQDHADEPQQTGYFLSHSTLWFFDVSSWSLGTSDSNPEHNPSTRR
jgi:hypothetical protein